MGWNNGLERMKFEAKQKKQAEEYRREGMSEEKIKKMYDHDLVEFNRKRRTQEHEQSLEPYDFDPNEDNAEKLTIYQKYPEQLTCTIENSGAKSRYWWIEEIEDEHNSRVLKSLNPLDREIITMMVEDGMTNEAIAQKMGLTKRTIERKKANFRKILKK